MAWALAVFRELHLHVGWSYRNRKSANPAEFSQFFVSNFWNWWSIINDKDNCKYMFDDQLYVAISGYKLKFSQNLSNWFWQLMFFIFYLSVFVVSNREQTILKKLQKQWNSANPQRVLTPQSRQNVAVRRVIPNRLSPSVHIFAYGVTVPCFWNHGHVNVVASSTRFWFMKVFKTSAYSKQLQ